jgi:hypothetical protein
MDDAWRWLTFLFVSGFGTLLFLSVVSDELLYGQIEQDQRKETMDCESAERASEDASAAEEIVTIDADGIVTDAE